MLETGGGARPSPGSRVRGRTHLRSAAGDGLGWRVTGVDRGGPYARSKRRGSPPAGAAHSSSSKVQCFHYHMPSRGKRDVYRVGDGARTPDAGFFPLSRDTYYCQDRHRAAHGDNFWTGQQPPAAAKGTRNYGDAMESSQERIESARDVYLNEPALGAARRPRRPRPAWKQTLQRTAAAAKCNQHRYARLGNWR